MDGWPSICR